MRRPWSSTARVGLIGSANLDRRSFELNFENNILFADPSFAAVIRARQDDYLARFATAITADTLACVGLFRRIWQNLLATMSPCSDLSRRFLPA